jgi:hypothetical protein
MFKGRHFDRSVILLCVRWYPAYSLSLRNLEEMVASAAFLSITRPFIAGPSTMPRSCWSNSIGASARSPTGGMSMRHISKFAAGGGICTEQSIATAARLDSGSASGAIGQPRSSS